MRIWDAGTGSLLVTLIGVGNSDYIAIGADGSFSASPGAFADLRLVRGFEVIPVPDDYKAAFMRERSLDEITAAVK